MAKSYRIDRINETMREVISELVINQIKDPRIGLVTITSVRVAQDLGSAKVRFSVMGDESVRSDTLDGLKSAARFMRTVVGRELKMRNAPELRFVYDDSLDRAIAIEEALRKDREGHGDRDA
jgi:ribosome-binding factor A